MADKTDPVGQANDFAAQMAKMTEASMIINLSTQQHQLATGTHKAATEGTKTSHDAMARGASTRA